MLDRRILERLGQLNREALSYGSGNPIRSPLPTATVSENPLRGAVRETCWGEHWWIEDRLSELAPGCQRELQAALRFLPVLNSSDELHPEVSRFAEAFPERTLYLDLETCGFAGSMVFLVGLLRWTADGGFVLTQLLARSYAEEKAILQTLWELAADKTVLISFNGKSFDWPVVHDRSTLYHLGTDPRLFPESATTSSARLLSTSGLTREDTRPCLEHFDLLHHSRRRWRTRLPNCRLQTLEYYICGRRRVGDIPGQQIPEAYHHFARTGETGQIRSILHHNALDLLTLWQLSIRLPLAARTPPSDQ
jgi:uncharacterized protein YprB with RNaseH-like and TPR domain